MEEATRISVNVPAVQDHTCAGNRTACVINNPVTHFSPGLQTEIVWFGLRLNLYVSMLRSVTFSFYRQNVFTEFDGLETETSLGVRPHRRIAICLANRSVSQIW